MEKGTKTKNKKQIIWPTWAKRALCIALLVAVLAGIVVVAILSNNSALRSRIIVESKTGKFDVNQQMATFILWQSYFDYYREYYNMYGSYYGIDESQVDFYALDTATEQTTTKLNSGLNGIKEDLVRMVAYADAAYEEGLKLDANDKKAIGDYVSNIQNLYIMLGYANSDFSFEYFLSIFIGAEMKRSDIEDAAELFVMSQKYYDYKVLQLQDDPDADVLQDYILRNPTNFFVTDYSSFEKASEAMIRNFFTENFINDRFESTLAKHYADIDCLAITNLKENALTAKLEELALNNAQKYTKTTTDGKATYSPELDEAIGKYIFNTANTAGKFATISGDKCAYLIYFKEDSTATEATVAFKKYAYEDAKVALEEAMAGNDIATIKDLLISCIKEGENTTEYLTDNDKAAKLFEDLKREIELPDLGAKNVTLKKGDTTTELPASIVKAIYPEGKDSSAHNGWIFVVNDPTESYVVKTTGVNSEKTECVVSYVTYTDDIFASVLTTFEAGFSRYLLESKVTAPSYNNEEMNTEVFEKAVIQWLMDENFKELVLTKEANKVYDELKTAMADSNSNVLTEKLNSIFGENGVKEYEDYYSTKKNLDPAVYDYIFNTKNKNTANVVIGKNDRVFLVYVAPTTGSEHEGHDHPTDTTVVAAAIKEFEFDAENEEMKSLMTSISDALATDDRKAPEGFAKSAEDIAKAALEGFKKTEGATPWEGFTSISVTREDTGKDYQAIISKIYPNGKSTTSVSLKTGEFYQADNNGTSYIFKITEINTSNWNCTVEYVTFEDETNYSYFRAIQSKLIDSFAEVEGEKYPSSITTGSSVAWLFESEYKAAEGENKSSLTFDRQANDMTFIATTKTQDGKTVVDTLNIYIVKTAAKQDNDTTKTVYGALQYYENEKDANKALKKLTGKTGNELYEAFSDLTYREKRAELSGYVIVYEPQFYTTIKKDDLSNNKNQQDWFFNEERKNNDIGVVPSENGTGFYLVAYFSSEEAWQRSARDGWINEQITNQANELVKDYTINQNVLDLTKDVTTTTAATK